MHLFLLLKPVLVGMVLFCWIQHAQVQGLWPSSSTQGHGPSTSHSRQPLCTCQLSKNAFRCEVVGCVLPAVHTPPQLKLGRPFAPHLTVTVWAGSFWVYSFAFILWNKTLDVIVLAANHLFSTSWCKSPNGIEIIKITKSLMLFQSMTP